MLLVPNYRKTNFANIRREIESVNWNQCLDIICIDETYKTFTANLKSIVNEAEKRNAYKNPNYHS